MDPLYNAVETNALESVGGKKMKSKSQKKSTAWMEDGDSAHWIASKSNKKRSARKASSTGETKKRFKANTITVKSPGSKKKARIKM